VPSNVVANEAEDAVAANFEGTIAGLARAGVAIRRENLDLFDEIRDITERHGTLTAAEAYHEYRDIIESDRVRDLDRRVVYRICAGKAMSADDLLTILHARRRLGPKLIELLDGAYLAMPTTPITAPEIAPLEASDDTFHKTNILASRNTMPVNFLDLCAVALPNGSNEAGLPTSFQLIAPHGEDERLLAVAREVEGVTVATLQKL
jgi:aspartyl-tRNA(Asn)/glutamyl-tRNA(Gln) amidotransferase subunit A